MLKQFSGIGYGANTYVVYNDNKNKQGKRDAFIVDPGNPVGEILSYAVSKELDVKYIILSHGHYDHVSFIEEYKRTFPDAATVCHEEESKVLTDPEANVSYLFGDTNAYEDCAVKVKEGDNIVLSGIDDNGAETDMKFTVMHTPGHTPGCICLYNEEEKLMLTGDTLFAGGYGRTDFKYGSGAELMRSLRRLLSMEDEIVFYSGHGEMSRIGWEKV